MEREHAERDQWRDELKAREWTKRLGRAAIPDKFADRTLGSYMPENDGQVRALARARQYADNFDEVLLHGTCFVFCGKKGTGKTHLAIGIAHQIMAAGRSALFMSVARAIRSIKETYDKTSNKTEAQAYRDLVEPDLLILDEAGIGFGSDYEKNVLLEIINGRYETSRPTIMTSNLAAPALEVAIGERSFDRLREGGGKLVVFDWESYRSRRPT
jgi:DNA replication protein DnaC